MKYSQKVTINHIFSRLDQDETLARLNLVQMKKMKAFRDPYGFT